MKKQLLISLLLMLFSAIGFSQTIQRIEAENYSAANGVSIETNAALSGGKNIGNCKNGYWIRFTGHVFSEYDTRFDIAAASRTQTGSPTVGTLAGTVEIRIDAVGGTLIGTANINTTSTGNWTTYQIFPVAIAQTTGTHDLYFVFKPLTGNNYVGNFDYFEKVTNNANANIYTLSTNVSPVSGGTITASQSGTQFVDGTQISLTAAANFGYNFVRWTDGNGTPVSTANPVTFAITANTTYVAEFKAVNTYTISYQNSIDGSILTGLTPTAYTEATSVTLPAPTLLGYTFYGWSTSPTVPNTIKKIETTTTGNQTFYAFWGTAGGNQKGTPAFPGAEGYGKYVTGGRGGKVIYVTNLNDSGAGSLRAAIAQSGPRIVVFKVSGTIKLESELNITDNITIAGQTAPGGGITLRDYNVKVRGNNIIVRYLRFRMGDVKNVENDALGGRFQNNIIIDHCSMSWSTDECVSFYQNENFTLQWCIISESLRNSVHGKGAHGYGGVWGGRNASFHHNLLAHHDSRNPRLGEYANDIFALTDLVDVRNNVIYNWGGNSCYGGDGMNVNLVNNYWKPGPGTSKNTKERILSTGRILDATSPMYGIWGKYYVDGNYVDGSPRTTQDNWTYGVFNQFHGSQLPVTEANKEELKIETPHPFAEITTHSATKAYELILDHAGANLFRDAVDIRAVSDTRSGTASIMDGGNGSTNGYIDTQTATGGWPVLPTAPAPDDTDEDGMPDSWETEKGLNPSNAADGNLKSLDTEYTNIEVYINSIVKQITDVQNGTLAVPKYANKSNLFYAYPTVGKNEITLKSFVDNDTVAFINLAGLVVKQVNTTNLETIISINDLADGIYIIKSLKTGLTTRIIVK
ncbi:carbohydrate-binding protein [Flavobacterium pectinovorum]|uniref:carbohydrate-binding protein n=1 Tax=Flavobacterium pectinovorum TaxID=29533 RepID=UPI001FAC83D8|nr:carbohydrate-binding protein [Flavobacterium pectinovorum]MCI9846032.1 carbohydrate-binding protein [Flavobacterium pectinovorum]